ncbi:hypothetical protein GYMLUDRAFT_249192 [Collybiopsis luxurians FD-317 M1]|uniref:Unplaced genomic scaffold GYMLUscaffold_64, whole genome shotgun sequence n=1 Tax=Collybiopsis luxurians FD-317 M1 TaxID=944289 RepID=A0A0D0BJC1_9AGAR|nr:hypothetical protein GYMLUDRAFT_249192 [Collybiopsis luxurians FD-317 M1]
MFTLVAISKAVTSVLGITLLLLWPVSSTLFPNFRIDTSAFTQAPLFSRPESSALCPHPDVKIGAPTFTQVYNVVAELEADKTIPGPFGGRLLHGFLGGNITDATTGALVGHVLPGLGGDFGLISNVNNELYTDLSFVLQWVDDRKFAYIHIHGVGSIANNTATATSYTQMETDSSSRQHLVNSFLLMGMAIPNPASPKTIGFFKLFAKSNPDGAITDGCAEAVTGLF